VRVAENEKRGIKPGFGITTYPQKLVKIKNCGEPRKNDAAA
jgi:hypothetical protein